MHDDLWQVSLFELYEILEVEAYCIGVGNYFGEEGMKKVGCIFGRRDGSCGVDKSCKWKIWICCMFDIAGKLYCTSARESGRFIFVTKWPFLKTVFCECIYFNVVICRWTSLICYSKCHLEYSCRNRAVKCTCRVRQ